MKLSTKSSQITCYVPWNYVLSNKKSQNRVYIKSIQREKKQEDLYMQQI